MSNIKPFFCTAHYSKNCLLENEIETVRYLGTGAEMSRYFGTSLMVPRCQDTSDPGHFRPKTFRHHPTGAEVSGQFGTSAEMSRGHFGTGTELSRPPANIFATTVIQKKVLFVIIINEDH